MEIFSRQCQSCSMPLKNGEEAGTEADGSKSTKYCHLCYANGKFYNPDMTLDEMKITVDNALKEQGWIKPFRMLTLWQLPTLERWQK